MDFREEMLEAYRRAYQAHPGLETFRNRKKRLLWGMMGLFALGKLLSAVRLCGDWGFAAPVGVILGTLLGLAIPGIFALAVWRGNWRFSFLLLLPAAGIALELFRSWFPAMASGGSFVPLFYVALALSVVTCLYLVGVTLWLAAPARNREYGEILNQVTEALILRSKEIAAQQKAQGGPGVGANAGAVPPTGSAPVPPPPTRQPDAPAEACPSCYRQIAAAAGEDGLPGSFSLRYPGIEAEKIRFAEGARDGITMYHTRVETKDDPALHEILALISAGYLHSEEKLKEFFGTPDQGPRMLNLIDGLQDWIVGHREELNPGMLYRFAGYLIRESSSPECVKFGLTLLEMLHGSPEEEQETRRVISTLALCDEFTLFCLYVIRGWADGADELFRLAQKVHGWGRIFIVHELEPDTPEKKDWLLREGWRNTVLDNYSAALCAKNGGLLALLEQETLPPEDYAAARSLVAALLEEQPLPGISGMEEGEKILDAFLRHAARQQGEADQTALKRVIGYLDSKGRTELADRYRGLLAE